MNKTAKIIKDHLSGRKTTASKKIFASISSKLREAGYKPPFSIKKKSALVGVKVANARLKVEAGFQESYEDLIESLRNEEINVGDKVYITEGPFSGWDGIVLAEEFNPEDTGSFNFARDEDMENDRFRQIVENGNNFVVKIRIFGKPVDILLDKNQVVKFSQEIRDLNAKKVFSDEPYF